MAYITLEEAKRHLNIEADFTGDDSYITTLIDAAEGKVAEDILRPLEELEDGQGAIPAPLRQAILLQVGDFYASREDTVYGVIVHSTGAYKALTGLYRHYE